jgi:enoyl-CoA hydratase/carnithine racemase
LWPRRIPGDGAVTGDDALARAFGAVGISVGDDHVAIVEIRRPPDNFFDAGLIASIADAYLWAEEVGARAIVLCSQGKNFCAGADFSGRSAQAGLVGSEGGARELYQEAVRLFEAKLPVVAAVQGAAVGGGLGLACSADFRVASRWSSFTANFARLGLHQGFGLSVTLPAIVGQQRAMNMLYTGLRIDGRRALWMDLVDDVVGDLRDDQQGVALGAAKGTDQDINDIRRGASEMARQIAGSAPLAVRSIRATLRAGLADRVRQAMDAELTEQGRLWRTADFAEGVRAYAERRPPRFEGR